MNTGRGIITSLLFFFLLLVTTLGAAFYSSVYRYRTVAPVAPVVTTTPVPAVRIETQPTVVATSSLWFLGDVMLSREVATRIRAHGDEYPWKSVKEAFAGTMVMVNFESCLSDSVAYTPQEPLRFPAPSSTAYALAQIGVSHVSLANNHALDCGAADLLATRAWFATAGIEAIGHPVAVSEESVGYITLGDKRVALIAIHTLFTEPSLELLTAVVASSSLESDFQVVFIHWGEEYSPEASRQQRQLATTLAQLGVDIIIGHHPHVVQPIERIGNTLVLYSLGNFIFDQYFSEAVQSGLAAKLGVGEGVVLTLRPVTSTETRNQPQFMSASATVTLLDDLATRSDPRLYEQIKAGTIDLFFLASSSKSAIITQ